MYSEDDITSAVNAGILSEQTAMAFRAHVAQRGHAPAVDEEHFRLITGFNDIFVVIACALLLVSVNWIGADVTRWFGALATAAVAWALAEFFVRQRRMALPAIVLLLVFVGSVFYGIYALTGREDFSIASSVAALAAWCHWLRFRVPITAAAGAAAVVGSVVGLVFAVLPEAKSFVSPILFIGGVAVFAFAMWWDTGDTLRLTGRSDVAFWLHLLAAPLLVHPVFSSLAVSHGDTSLGQGLAVIALYIAIALVSLTIDRRALMVSALAYVLYAFSSLLKSYGIVNLGFATTALTIGFALLMLSAFWHPCRTFVVQALPPIIKNRLPAVR